MTSPKDNTRYLAIMQSAKKLFWKYGLRRVSVEDICHEADVSKMTFYRYFPNKIEVAKAVYDLVVQKGKQDYLEILKDDTTISEKITRMINLKIEGTNDISREFILDLYKNPDSGLVEHVKKVTEESWNEIIRYFRLSQRKGIFRKDIKPEFLLYFSKKMGEMITDDGLIGLYDSPRDVIAELTNFFVFGISERNLKQ